MGKETDMTTFMAQDSSEENNFPMIETTKTHNGITKVLLTSILIITLATCLTVILMAIWPLPEIKIKEAYVEIPPGVTLHPGDAITWTVVCEEGPEGIPVRHSMQLILQYPGSNVLQPYEPTEVVIRRDETKYGVLCMESGKLTLPDGNFVANRKFKIRHTYTVIGDSKRVSQSFDTPWYNIGDFTKFEKRDDGS